MLSIRILLLTSATLAFTNLAHAQAMDWLSIGGKAPEATLYSLTGAGTANASAKGRVGAPSIKEHCGNWRPDDVAGCIEITSPEFLNHEASASANCLTGSLISDGQSYQSAGVWKAGVGEGRVRFQSSAGQIVDPTGAGGGLMLAQRWEVLCPGATIVNQTSTGARPAGKMAAVEVVDMRRAVGFPYDHNGSEMIVVPDQGLIYYSRPKRSIAGTIKPGTVLFRGQPWNGDKPNAVLKGTARVFKAGCPSAEYSVSGGYRNEFNEIVLKGAAPIRSKTSCDLVGESSASANAALHFSGIIGD